MLLEMCVALFCGCGLTADSVGTPLWREFVDARAAGRESVLPDFSYAGYKFSEQPLPDVAARPRFVVTNYGARPNDADYDDEGIQAAIDAASAAGGGVVYFPAGRFLIAADQDASKHIRIAHSNVVLKGSGAGDDGTEIFQKERRIGARQFVFQPMRQRSERLTTIVRGAAREQHWVDVADSSPLRVGQNVVIRHRSESFTRQYFDPLPLAPEWARLIGPGRGMEIHEIHTIAEIDGTRVRFVNPLHFDLVIQSEAPFRLESYPTIAECGVEDIRFTGHWDSYPEDFVHHKDAIHDSGWCALAMEYVEDAWIRSCEFRNYNECVLMRGAYKATVENVAFTGKRGHTSVHARTGYGVLIKHCTFSAGHHHGPGNGYGAVGTVVSRCTMEVDQNIDCHSGQPFATLFDDVDGGVFSNLGGPWEGLPHHGKHLVLWNFRHRSSRDFHYNFWDVARRRNHTIARPILVGFQADTKITFQNEGVSESPGGAVEPPSLFEAQLVLRLQKPVKK